MERLTNRYSDGTSFIPNVTLSLTNGMASVIEKLAEYEDAEEQGLLLRLPCKVGTKVYQIHTLQISKKTILAEVETDTFFMSLCLLEGRFGKTVFLTREEAEQALKQMEE